MAGGVVSTVLLFKVESYLGPESIAFLPDWSCGTDTTTSPLADCPLLSVAVKYM